MKKLISLILAVGILTALCACAEKLKEITLANAKNLASEEYAISKILEGSHNSLNGEIINENGIDYAPADNSEIASWDDFTNKLKSIYTPATADSIFASNDCLNADGKTYLRYIGSADSKTEYDNITFGDVVIDGNSNSKKASALMEINSSTVKFNYENSSDGWRISERTDFDGASKESEKTE